MGYSLSKKYMQSLVDSSVTDINVAQKKSMNGIQDNFIAFAIAILKDRTNVDEILFKMGLFPNEITRKDIVRQLNEDILLMKNSGMSIEEIAVIVGYSKRTINTKLKEMRRQ